MGLGLLRSEPIPAVLGEPGTLSNDLQTTGAQGRVSPPLISDKQPELTAPNDGTAGKQLAAGGEA